jgi:hypothetical protein
MAGYARAVPLAGQESRQIRRDYGEIWRDLGGIDICKPFIIWVIFVPIFVMISHTYRCWHADCTALMASLAKDIQTNAKSDSIFDNRIFTMS